MTASFYVMHADCVLYNVPTYEAAVAKIDAEPAHIKRDLSVWNSTGDLVATVHRGTGHVIKPIAKGAKFQAGKTYWTTSIGDSECVYTVTVLRRTAKTLYVTDEGGKSKTLRVKIDTYDGGETVAPKGSVYSMSPTIRACREGSRPPARGISMPEPSYEPADFDDPLRFMHRMG